jgi:bacillopeptidase F
MTTAFMGEVYIRAAMAHRVRAILILASAAAVSCAGSARPLTTSRTPKFESRFEGDFRARLTAADPARRFIALVDLTEQLDLKSLGADLRARRGGKRERRALVIASLESTASRQQARLAPLLSRLTADGSIASARPVAIVNRIVVEGTAAGLLALATSPEVAIVRPDWTSEGSAGRSHAGESVPAAPGGAPFRSWAVDALRAESLWRAGWDGDGVVVASIDTGAYEAHEQLRAHRLAGERGWFDPVEGSTVGSDRHGHGTGVLSCAVGANPAGRVVGIAPNARWASALGNWRNFYSRARMPRAADWVLRVARPDVLINAWSHGEGPCNDFDRPFIDAWKASGIFVVFPAGNGGPARASGESPAQLSGIFPDGGAVFSVAALAAAGGTHGASSRGPSRCGSRAFPMIAAPGTDLPIATPGAPDAYGRGDGTSLSAGLAGGAAAVLLQAAPETEPEVLERVLVASTRDIPPAGYDDATGAGAIDLAAALKLLTRD